jgi:xanthine/uracil permease
MVNYGDLQFAERIMMASRSEMSAEWKARFAICIASVAIQAFTKLLFSLSSLDSYFCWSPPVVLGHTVCSIGLKYILHTVVGRFFE